MPIPKTSLSSDWSLQPDSTKLDSLVIAHQPRRGEYVPGRVEKRRGWFILALGALGYAASSVGFGDLISVVYPVFGYCSSVFIVCLLVHAAQTRKKEYKFFENSGTKEEEISS